MKIIIYVVYVVIFTYCYYFLNKKLSNKSILILYPLVFFLSIYPLKLLYNAILPNIGAALAKEYLIVLLFAISMITLFNFSYGIVNMIITKQTNFHQNYGMPAKGHIKWFLKNATNFKNLYHLFFYSGGIILYTVVIFKSKI